VQVGRITVAAAAVALLGMPAFGGAAVAGGPQLVAVEIAPEDPSPGGQFAIVVNRGDTTIDLGCWRLRSSTGRLVVAPPLRLAPGAAALLTARRAWLSPVDRVRLHDAGGRLRSATPQLADRESDDRVWYRTVAGTWQFGRTSFGKGVAAGHLERAPGRC
jgi:hypothetical protein